MKSFKEMFLEEEDEDKDKDKDKDVDKDKDKDKDKDVDKDADKDKDKDKDKDDDKDKDVKESYSVKSSIKFNIQDASKANSGKKINVDHGIITAASGDSYTVKLSNGEEISLNKKQILGYGDGEADN